MFLRVNPFDFVNEVAAAGRVARLRKTHPEMTRRQMSDVIISKKSRCCAFSGAVTALPGMLPGVGTVLTLLGGTAFDLVALMYFMSEMIMEMALLYDRDFRKQDAAREAVWVFMSAVGTDAVSKNVSKFTVRQMGRQAFVKFTQDLLISMGIRISQRSVVKIIPLLGAVVSGTVNYFMCRKVGGLVADYYDKNSPEDWGGVTIDI